MPELFYFSDAFQNTLLACLMRHPSKFAAVANILEPRFFWGLHSTKLCQILQEYRAKHGHFPTFNVIEDYVKEHYGREQADLAEEENAYVRKLAKLSVRDVAYIREKFVMFCRERALIHAIEKSADAIRQGKWPDTGFAPMFDQALRVGQDLENIGLRLYEDADLVIDRITAKTYGVRTGYPLLDKVWYNGWGQGWLVVPLAPPKSFKTMFSLNLALNMTSQAMGDTAVNVHYYACEISAELALARAYCRAAKMPMKSLYQQTEIFRTAMHQGLERRWKNGGKMLAKTFPAKTATIADIRAHALNAIEALGWNPQVIFIDHAETIRAPKTNRDLSDWRAQAEIYTQARALASELQCVVVMPDRCTRDTVQNDVPSMTSFQGSFEKAGIVDVALGLCVTEEERLRNQIRYFVFVNRHGEQYGYFRGTVYADKGTMTVDHELNFEMERQRVEPAHPGPPRKDRRPKNKALPGMFLAEAEEHPKD